MMMFDDYYIQVDNRKKIFLSSFQTLPENWNNICGLNTFSDEQLKDLTWTKNKDIGWINFKSPEIKEYNSTRDNFLRIKEELRKKIYDFFKQLIITKIEYRNYFVLIDEETRKVLYSKFLATLVNESVTMKIKCNDKVRTFDYYGIQKIFETLDKIEGNNYDTRVRYYEMIDKCNSVYELTQQNYDI